ncbi:MAG: flagellar motor switch protein FliG [Treponema sp.]|nr:flagellar motor switch protein FliG [Treponema sp.]
MGNILRRGLDAYKQTIKIPLHEDQKKDSRAVGQSIHHSDGQEQPDSKYRRVAKFLILIGGEQAAGILAELDPDQIEKISKEIALIKVIKPDEGQEILEEFQNLFSMTCRYSGLSRGGIEAARRILYAAMGPEKGEALLNKAVPVSRENLFSFLEEFTSEQLAMLIKEEAPQMAALILSRLPPKLSAGTISKLAPESKPEILKRIAHQGEVSPEVLEQVSAALKEKVRHISGGAKDFKIDGMQTLTAILKQGDYAFGDWIVNELEESHPAIGKDLKNSLYTLDDVIYTVDRPVQEKLKTMSDREIAILLKGRGNDFSDKLLSCVSANRRQLIREEGEILGAVPKRDCDAAASEFLAWFRLAREKGDIMLYTDKDLI